MGGGAVGPGLMEAALATRPQCSLRRAPWRLIVGPHLPEADFTRLRQAAGNGVAVERFRPDFRRLLAAAKLSVSYAGYNTCADLMRARVPTVLITYSGGDGGETEQAARAQKLAGLGMAHVIPDRELTPERLAHAIDAALTALMPPAWTFRLDGAEQSAMLLESWAAATTHQQATSGR